MNRLLILLGLVLVVAGVAWPWIRRLRLFHLPGDIAVNRPGFQFYLPITTMLIVSVCLSVLAWLIRK
jgi:hypothetical protein